MTARMQPSTCFSIKEGITKLRNRETSCTEPVPSVLSFGLYPYRKHPTFGVTPILQNEQEAGYQPIFAYFLEYINSPHRQMVAHQGCLYSVIHEHTIIIRLHPFFLYIHPFYNIYVVSPRLFSFMYRSLKGDLYL